LAGNREARLRSDFQPGYSADHGNSSVFGFSDRGGQPRRGRALRMAGSTHPAVGGRMSARGFGKLEIIGGAMVLGLVVVALFAPLLAPHDPTRAVAATYGDPGAPSLAFPLGTDQLGRDVLSRIIYGARISLTVGVAAMAVTIAIGVLIGLVSGFFGGAIDVALMRFTDVMLTLPALLLAMAFVAVLRPSLLSILLVIGLVSWTQVARVVRAETLSMSRRDFVLAAQALGAHPGRLIARHVLPNVLPVVVVMAALGTSNTLLLDAALSFLGLGVPPPTPTWGRMIEEATIYFRTAPWLATFPGLAIFYAVLGFNLLAYGVLRARPPMMRPGHGRAFFAFAMGAPAALFLFGCGKGGGEVSLPRGAAVLRIADADDVPTLDPAAGYDTESWTFEQAIFDTLVRYGDDNVDLEPDLATTWESSSDARTFTFHLRRDARFSTGRGVTSDDFRYAIERVLDPATNSRGMEYYRGIVGSADFAAHRAAHLRGIETPDPFTIVFHLDSPDPIFVHKLTMPFASAVPRE